MSPSLAGVPYSKHALPHVCNGHVSTVAAVLALSDMRLVNLPKGFIQISKQSCNSSFVLLEHLRLYDAPRPGIVEDLHSTGLCQSVDLSSFQILVFLLLYTSQNAFCPNHSLLPETHLGRNG